MIAQPETDTHCAGAIPFPLPANSPLRQAPLGAGLTNAELCEKVILRAEKVFDLRAGDIRGKRRTNAIAWPRQMAMWTVRSYTRLMSLEAIGQEFGGRDHGTVLHAVRTVSHRIEIYAEERSHLNRLLMSLRLRFSERYRCITRKSKPGTVYTMTTAPASHSPTPSH